MFKKCSVVRAISYQSWLILVFSIVGLFFTYGSSAESPQEVRYSVLFKPDSQSAQVTVAIEKSSWLDSVLFRPLDHTSGEVSANGKIKQEGEYLRWYPPKKKARLSYNVKLNLEKKGGGYDALVKEDWAVLRGEDLFPSFRSRKDSGATSKILIEFQLPKNWIAVHAGWPRVTDTIFVIEDENRALVRPPGWIIAGDLGTRKEQLGSTQIIISAPKGHNFRQMEALAFLSMVWPSIEKVFDDIPQEILITGAGDPMWRGGLSAPTSLYIHSDRPLVSENGTSTHIHELMHILTDMHGAKNADWIVEGIAEFYSVEFLYRAGAYNTERRDRIFEGLAEWGENVKSLVRPFSYGEYTARSAVLFDSLDKEIRQCTQKKSNLDDLIKPLIGDDAVSLKKLKQAYDNICDKPSNILSSQLAVDPTKTSQ